MALSNTPNDHVETSTGSAKVCVQISDQFTEFLRFTQTSLVVSSYQCGRLFFLGRTLDGKFSLHDAQFDKAMGLCGDKERLFLGTRTQLVRLENILKKNQTAQHQHDRLFLPRNSQTLGDLHFHEVAERKNGSIVFVNSKFSCLAAPSETHSFRPIWKPDFISRLAPEDRCHLNGLAMVNGEPRYVTAVSRSDWQEGWRAHRRDGGIVIDIHTDEVVAEGLSMPHSPRWRAGKLWVLNAGKGELGWIDFSKPPSAAFTPVMFFPGFTRGLCFVGQYAIVALSKPRRQSFDGLELDEQLAAQDLSAICGIQIMCLKSGTIEHKLSFDGAVQELFDILPLPGVRSAIALSPNAPELDALYTIENPPTVRQTEVA